MSRLFLLASLAASVAIAATPIPFTPVMQHQKDGGVYFISDCFPADGGDCCLFGYVGVDKYGFVTTNVGGADKECGDRLAVLDTTQRARFQIPKGAPDTILETHLSVRHPRGTQRMLLRLLDEETRIDIINDNPRRNLVVKGVRDGEATLTTTLEEGLEGRFIAHLPEHYTEGMSGAATFFLVTFVMTVLYVLGGIAWTRRNGGDWSGKFVHPHRNEWHVARVFVTSNLKRGFGWVLEKLRYGNARDDPLDHVHASPAPKLFRGDNHPDKTLRGGIGLGAMVRERRRSNDSLGDYSRAFRDELDAAATPGLPQPPLVAGSLILDEKTGAFYYVDPLTGQTRWKQ